MQNQSTTRVALAPPPAAHDSGRACSPSHISSRGSITCFSGGTTVQLRGIGYPRAGRPTYRGKITSYTKRSRSRFLAKLGELDRERLPAYQYFVTLTYPGQFPDKPSIWRRDLDVWRHRLERRYGPCPAFWRLEAQKRGAPHWHIVWFSDRKLDKRWVSDSWYEVVGSGDERHRRAGTNVKRLAGWKQLAYYVSKYVAKADQSQPGLWDGLAVGRWWGVWRASLLPVNPVTVELTAESFHRVRRVFARLARSRGRRWPTSRRLAGGWTYLEADDQGRILLYAAGFPPPCVIECPHESPPDIPANTVGLPTGVPFEVSMLGWPVLRLLDGVGQERSQTGLWVNS